MGGVQEDDASPLWEQEGVGWVHGAWMAVLGVEIGTKQNTRRTFMVEDVEGTVFR